MVGKKKRVKAMKGKRVKAMGGKTMKGKRVKAMGGGATKRVGLKSGARVKILEWKEDETTDEYFKRLAKFKKDNPEVAKLIREQERADASFRKNNPRNTRRMDSIIKSRAAPKPPMYKNLPDGPRIGDDVKAATGGKIKKVGTRVKAMKGKRVKAMKGKRVKARGGMTMKGMKKK